MKLISWNVNGLRACLEKGFIESVRKMDPDVICLQETKMKKGQAAVDLPEYKEYWNDAVRPGYSGTAVFSKIEPLSVAYGIGIEDHDQEGRVITCEYPDFYLVNVYVPNSGEALKRLDYRMQWDADFRAYLKGLEKEKPVVLCGDLNVAHQEIDLKNPASNRKNAGFTDEERANMTTLLGSGFTDSFRFLYPDKTGAYSWWSYRFNARNNNAGWRIDYFVVSKALDSRIEDSLIYPDIMGSDHCPVALLLK